MNKFIPFNLTENLNFMKRSLFILPLICSLLFLLLSLSGCVFEPGAEIVADNPENILKTDSKVTRSVALEDAIAEMYSLMNDLWPGTRASSKSIKSIELLGAGNLPKAKTRSGNSLPDSLLYIVNFNAGGFAVLAADTNLEPVIAITEAGELQISDFESPSSVPSGYTLDDLWVETHGDYMLGGVQPDEGASYIAGLILNYAVNGGGINTDPLEPDGGGKPGEPEGPNLPPENPGVTYTWHTTNWVVDNSNTRRKLMPDNLTWNQEAPFNEYCPVMIVNKAPAGCVATALMQIFAYHEKPEADIFFDGNYSTIYGDVVLRHMLTLSWPALTRTPYGSYDTSLRHTAGWIARYIGNGVGMLYNFFGSEESFATPEAAKIFMKHSRINYKSVVKHLDYDEDIVKSEVMAGRPLFIGALDNFNAGHAWVLDGWMERTSVTEKRGSDGSVPISITYRQKLVHCNWGWGGRCNGYYYSGTLDLNNGGVIQDNPLGSNGGKETKKLDFNWWFRLITYKLP